MTALAGAANSAPGPDGLPYAAWQKGGEPAARVLLQLYRHMSGTGAAPPPPSFGASVAVFLPKGDAATDEVASGRCDRMASQKRPLALCKSDRKTIAAVANQPLRTRLPRSTPQMQCGFVRGRMTVTQIVGLEAVARQATILATSRAFESGWLPPPLAPASPPPAGDPAGANPTQGAGGDSVRAGPSRRWHSLAAAVVADGALTRRSVPAPAEAGGGGSP